jgi:hypothetical protein
MPDIEFGLHDVSTTICKRITVNSPSVFHAEIQYNYNYNGFQVAHAQLLGLLDAMGAQLNPQIIWNAIPWSFVVDWVLGVSRWLGQFKGYNMEPVINIQRFLTSVKRTRSVYITLENERMVDLVSGGYWYQGYPGLRNTLPGVHESAYRRDVNLPTVSSILASGLTLTEISLGAALVTSRRFNPKRAKRWKVKL